MGRMGICALVAVCERTPEQLPKKASMKPTTHITQHTAPGRWLVTGMDIYSWSLLVCAASYPV